MNELSIKTIPEKNHALLTTQHLGMLTTVRSDGMLSTNPVGFVWDGERIQISTLKSRVKYRNISADSRIAFCVQSAKNPMNYVEIRGFATLEDDLDRSFARRQFMIGSNGQEPPEDMDPPQAERVVITLHPQQISSPQLYGGRFDKPE